MHHLLKRFTALGLVASVSGFSGAANSSGVGNGTTSNSNTGLSSDASYQNTVNVYGANSQQAQSALHKGDRLTSTTSRSTLNTTNGQTYPSNGTFAPSPSGTQGASGIFTGVGTGAGMATGTGTGTGSGSTNASPKAQP